MEMYKKKIVPKLEWETKMAKQIACTIGVLRQAIGL